MKERIFKNPITSIVALIILLTGSGAFFLGHIEWSDFIKLIGGSSVLAILKDPKKVNQPEK